MTVQVDISNLEDQVLNALNSIPLITSDMYKNAEKENTESRCCLGKGISH